jgi:alkylhydroperoxidase/carboxymuconolactone decarboxylase family protein YurZ
MADDTVRIRVQVEGDEDLARLRAMMESIVGPTEKVFDAFREGAASTKDAMKAFQDSTRAIFNEYKAGNLSQAQAVAVLGDLKGAYDGLGISLVESSKANQYFLNVQNQISLGSKGLIAQMSQLNANVGALGGGLRSTNYAMMNLNRVVQDAPFGLIGISNNIQPLLESFRQLSAEASVAGVSMGSVLKTAFFGPQGMLLAIAAMTSLSVGLPKIIELFGGTNDASKKAAEDGFKKFSSMMDEITGKMDKFTPAVTKAREQSLRKTLQTLEARARILNQMYRDYVNGIVNPTISEAEAKVAGLTEGSIFNPKTGEQLKSFKELPDIIKGVREEAGKVAIELNSLTNVATATRPQMKEVADDALEIAKLLFETNQSTVTAYRDVLLAAEKSAGTERTRLEFQKQRLDIEEKYKRVLEAEAGFGATGIPGVKAPVAPKKLIGVDVSGIQKPETIQESLRRGEQQLNAFELSANDAFANMNTTIGSSIGQGFVEGFGMGHTLLGQFINDFISQFTSLAASGVLKGLFSFLSGGSFIDTVASVLGFGSGGWIPEPVLGIGASGRAYSFAENGPEYVSTARQMNESRMGRSQAQKVIVEVRGEARMRGTDLFYAIERATPVVKRSRV